MVSSDHGPFHNEFAKVWINFGPIWARFRRLRAHPTYFKTNMGCVSQSGSEPKIIPNGRFSIPIWSSVLLFCDCLVHLSRICPALVWYHLHHLRTSQIMGENDINKCQQIISRREQHFNENAHLGFRQMFTPQIWCSFYGFLSCIFEFRHMTYYEGEHLVVSSKTIKQYRDLKHTFLNVLLWEQRSEA